MDDPTRCYLLKIHEIFYQLHVIAKITLAAVNHVTDVRLDLLLGRHDLLNWSTIVILSKPKTLFMCVRFQRLMTVYFR